MIIEPWSISSWKRLIRIMRQRLELLRKVVLVKACREQGWRSQFQQRFCWSLTLTKNISCSKTAAWRWWCELYSYVCHHPFPVPAPPPFDLSPSVFFQYWIYWSDLKCFVLYPAFKFYLLLFGCIQQSVLWHTNYWEFKASPLGYWWAGAFLLPPKLQYFTRRQPTMSFLWGLPGSNQMATLVWQGL